MIRRKVKYNVINIIVILVAIAVFIYKYHDVQTFFDEMSIYHIIMMIVVALVVHVIKASRLYLALYGTPIKAKEYIKIYCKVTPVSILFPFKVGEFFRMYCYGMRINSLVRGVVIVILDRFMDTMALVTIVLLFWIFNGWRLVAVAYVLMLFLAFILLIYFAYPGVYQFWKKYALREKATENSIALLKAMSALNNLYQEIRSVSKGRGIILFFMSLVAWGTEIGNMLILQGRIQGEYINQTIAKYLSSAIIGEPSVELKRFIFISIIVMVMIYMVIKLAEVLLGKKENNESSGCV